MCGISGFFHFDTEKEASKEVLKRMTDAIYHRGPDGEGYYLKKNIALGHRRLAIIDLATGVQPMYSADKQIVIVFNGEIYNYLELRNELVILGCKFSTNSDTEVIISAYRTWGIDCQNHFNGMWSFALWDENLKRLFISRDRIGEKPLYYSCFDNTFIYGSEIKSVIQFGMPVNPNMDVLELYLTMGFVPAPYTFYKEIYQLMPGKYLLIDPGGISIHTYWNLPDINEHDLTKDQKLVEKDFAELFDDSVKIRMRSDVPFGAFLSGGLDSSCIVSTMSKYKSKPVKTFTIGFENKEFDESELAQMVADKFKTEHYKGVVSTEYFHNVLDKVIFHYDEPFGDSSAIPTGQISRYASKHVKMVLTGDGGDEVLSGYTIYQGEKFAQQYKMLPALIRNKLPSILEILSKAFKGSIRYRLNRVTKVLESSNLPFNKRLITKLCSVHPDDLMAIMKTRGSMISFTDFYNETMQPCRFKDPFYKLMYFQHKVTLPGDMLTKVDRMSMAYSIETRIPFLDKRIVEQLYLVDKNLKMKGYLNKTILRNSIANHSLPKKLLDAPKRGFRVPLRDWFKDDLLKTYLNKMILNSSADLFLDYNKISGIISQNKSGKLDAGNIIWMLLILNRWISTNKFENLNVASAKTTLNIGI